MNPLGNTAMRIIEVVAYNPEWKVKFEDEKKRLAGILWTNAEDIQHIGSTSVPGLSAKPTIDIMVLVRELNDVDEKNGEMSKAGYKAYGEYGIPGRRFFSKTELISEEDWVNVFHVHVFKSDDRYNSLRHLAVRDYLRTHPDRAEQYGSLKVSIASAHRNDNEAYISGKDAFVRKLEQDATEWYAGSRKLQ